MKVAVDEARTCFFLIFRLRKDFTDKLDMFPDAGSSQSFAAMGSET